MMRSLRFLAAVLGLLIVIAALHAAARFDLRGPTGLSSRELSAWVDDPIRALATTLRWLAIVLSYYLLAVVVALAVLGERATTGPMSRLIPSGLAAAVGLMLGAAAVGVPLASHMTATAGLPGGDNKAPDPLRLVHLDEPLELDVLSTSAEPLAPATGGVSVPLIEQVEDAQDTWQVESGDSFWSIAEETLEDAWDRTDLSETEIAEYWRSLIAANESQLVQPENPDLLLPGQQLVLPPPTP